MISYDATVIRSFAQALYDRASITVLVHTGIGVVVGGTVGKFAFGNGGMFMLAAFGGAIGYFIGSQKAFLLKLQAQIALCQVQIEQNTSAREDRAASHNHDAPSTAPGDLPTALQKGDTVSLGACPNCSAAIRLDSEVCPKCKASFGLGSAWKVESH